MWAVCIVFVITGFAKSGFCGVFHTFNCSFGRAERYRSSYRGLRYKGCSLSRVTLSLRRDSKMRIFSNCQIDSWTVHLWGLIWIGGRSAYYRLTNLLVNWRSVDVEQLYPAHRKQTTWARNACRTDHVFVSQYCLMLLGICSEVLFVNMNLSRQPIGSTPLSPLIPPRLLPSQLEAN